MNNNFVENKEKKLKNLLMIFIILCFIQIFFVGILDLFNQMFLILFIFLVIYYKNNIFIPQITIFFILIDLIFELFAFLLIIQNFLFNLINLPKMLFLFKFIFIIIYFLLLNATFDLYKEYKIQIITEGNYNYQNLNDIEMNNNYNNYNNYNYNYNNNNNNNFVPFQGQGYTWG